MKTIRWLQVLTAALFLMGCTAQSPKGVTQSPGATVSGTLEPAITAEPGASPVAERTSEEKFDLTALLPGRTGYHWLYEGFAEYSHEMALDAIEHSGQRTIYRITGMVGDPSGGESKLDHSLSITYTVTPDAWLQQASGPLLMDSDFPSIELLRGPLTQGSQWTQTVVGDEKQTMTLTCTIESVVDGGDGGPVYTILYRQQDGDYYERREIGKGRGVISFEKLYTPQSGESFAIGYRTYQQTQPTASPQPTAIPSYKEQIDPWLPPLDKSMRFFGLAEYGHEGTFFREWQSDTEAAYRFNGVYNDGYGTPDPFAVRYYADYTRGTVTEKALSNARTGKAELNSKIHNLVALKFPLTMGQTWHWEALFEGARKPVEAEVIELSADKVKVRYTVNGVSGYYDDTYFEERTFEKGYGMTGFSMLMPGDIEISGEDAKDPRKVREALLNQRTFGYSQDKGWLQNQ